MKKSKITALLLSIVFLFSMITTMSSCKVKEGCESSEKIANAHLDKHGNFKTKRGKSSLYGKKRKKRMGGGK